MGRRVEMKDRDGNIYVLDEAGQFTLHLKNVPGNKKPRRDIGTRLPSGCTDVLGIWRVRRDKAIHWHKALCWYIARFPLVRHKDYFFDIVYLVGWHPQGIKRGYVHPAVLLDKSIRKNTYAHYSGKGFEAQMAVYPEDLKLTMSAALEEFKRLPASATTRDYEQAQLFGPPEEAVL